MVDQVDRSGVVDYIEPVPGIFAVAVDRQRFIVQDIVDAQRDQLFGEMVRPVVVGTVGQYDRQPVGILVGSYEMVRRGLGGRVGGMGIVFCFFCKQPGIAQCPVYFIGGDMVEPFAFEALLPDFSGGVQQVHRTDHVGHHKSSGITDRTVDMRFRGQVDHPVGLVLFEDLQYMRGIGDVSFHKGVIRPVLDILQVLQVSGIGQGIQIDDLITGIFGNKLAHNMGTDEAGSAGD